MPTRLADTRTVPTMQDAEKLMADYRKTTCEREVIIARAEKRIAAISAKAQEDCAGLDRQLRSIEDSLGAFILANRELFVKPRQHQTPDGRFGLRDASRLEVEDMDALIEHILDCGYDDCVKISRCLVKPAVTKRITHGETMPGARVVAGEIVSVSVAKALIQEAVENA